MEIHGVWMIKVVVALVVVVILILLFVNLPNEINVQAWVALLVLSMVHIVKMSIPVDSLVMGKLGIAKHAMNVMLLLLQLNPLMYI